MKLIVSNKELINEFERLTGEYKKFYWIVAWASSLNRFPIELKDKTSKIEKVIVGLHFIKHILISLALNEIPAEGQITKEHYNKYIEYFTKTFKRKIFSTASRLLAMKRPATFYCLTSKNQRRLCKEFDITYSHLDYNGYWEQIIERIFDSDW